MLVSHILAPVRLDGQKIRLEQERLVVLFVRDRRRGRLLVLLGGGNARKVDVSELRILVACLGYL